LLNRAPTKATGLFGIGVKLAATQAPWIDGEDYEEAIAAVCNDIDRLIGSDFAARFAERATNRVIDERRSSSRSVGSNSSVMGSSSHFPLAEFAEFAQLRDRGSSSSPLGGIPQIPQIPQP
jgi:hypothetical protein